MDRTTAGRTVPAQASVLVFDGDCGFCTWSAGRLRRLAGPALAVVPWQRTDLESLGLTPSQCTAAVQYVGPTGHAAGGQAIGRALAHGGPPARVAGWVLVRPGLAPIVEGAYRLVAANRHRLPGATPACSLDDDARSAGGSVGQGPSPALAPPNR